MIYLVDWLKRKLGIEPDPGYATSDVHDDDVQQWPEPPHDAKTCYWCTTARRMQACPSVRING